MGEVCVGGGYLSTPGLVKSPCLRRSEFEEWGHGKWTEIRAPPAWKGSGQI